MPYAEHYNFSIQRELSKSTVLTLAYVGTQGHKLISQIRRQSGQRGSLHAAHAEGAVDLTTGFQPGLRPVSRRRTFISFRMVRRSTAPEVSGHNYCPTSSTGSAFRQSNTFTRNSANSNYNSFQATVERKAADVTFLAAYTFSKAIDDCFHLRRLDEFHELPAQPRPVVVRCHAQFRRQLQLGHSRSTAPSAALPKRLTQGWNINGITRFSTGFPIGISPEQWRYIADRQFYGHAKSCRTGRDSGSAEAWIPTARTPTSCQTLSLENTLWHLRQLQPPVLPRSGNRQHAISACRRESRFTESMAFEFRAEFFNIFNHTQFNNPNGNFSSSRFGVVTNARAPRIGQVSAKFYW